MSNNKDRNVTLYIKMKKDFLIVESTIKGWDDEGFYIGEDLYLLEEFVFNQEEERYYAKNGSLQIQI